MKYLLWGIGAGIGFFGACLAIGEIGYQLIKD
jgi:F0F1-type ATP synthase membrane subunit c/vacuolar-type H+-ATPase subunit K